MDPVARYDALIAEVIAKAHNAAMRNKPTMWAYYLEAADGLIDWFAPLERTHATYDKGANALAEKAERECPTLYPATASARLWALGIYARRIACHGSRRVSLTWLRERARVLVDEAAA